MSVKTLVSWSTHALSTHPVNVDMFKGLAHISHGERDNTVVRNSWCSHARVSAACLEASIKGI